MARTISEIKEGIAHDFMHSEQIAHAYGFTPGDSFTACFSKVSVESVLFYIFACAAWVLENLFDQHKREVSRQIEWILPHRPKWYRDKVLAFMKDRVLVTDSDVYDTREMTQDQITQACVVKHAVATENPDASILTIKVAGEQDGARCKLDEPTAAQLAAYIREIKDAGVRVDLVNIDAEILDCAVDIYYDPMMLPENIDAACREAVKNYIENLPFNGEYTNMALIDTLQRVEGVRIPEFKSASTRAAAETIPTPVSARYTPKAGYLRIGKVELNKLVYNE